jgi:IclR family acetate operon transcriptional repressor
LVESSGVKARRSYSIAAVDRVVAVLDAVAARQGRTLAGVARAAELDEATTLRYLSSLASHDLIERDDTNATYSLGLRLYQLGQQAVGVRDVRKVALGHMERLLEQFEETVNLGQWRADKLVVIDVLESPRSIRKGASIGDPDYWHASALGKSILAALPVEEARAFLERIDRPRFTGKTLVDVDEILESLPAIAERGYAIDDEEYEHGLRCVAAAVRDRRGRPTYAISISGVAARMPPSLTEQAGRAVAEAAAAIENVMGYVAQEEEERG